MKKSILITTRNNNHVATNTTIALESAFVNNDFKTVKESKNKYINKLVYRMLHLVPQLKIVFASIIKLFLKPNDYFVVLMGIVQIKKTLPYFLFNTSKSVYLFDCWEKSFNKVINEMKLWEVSNLFVSSHQSAEILNKKLISTKVHWIPEGINNEHFYSKPYHLKTIDIIQIGRKNKDYHQSILPYCLNNNRQYLYEKIDGKIIFDNQKDYYEGLASSKISICFSSDITHPNERGKISTMTQRYLESMLSKCLIIGNLPHDMSLLFDYNPIIEADFKNPEKQLEEIFNHFEKYIPLIEKNYQEVINKHLWKNRLSQIEEILLHSKQ